MEVADPRSYDANTLRKAGRFQEALTIYQDLWNTGKQNEFVAAGLLHCLRKLHRLADAMKFSENISQLYLESEWVRRELSWTYSEYVKEMATAGASVTTLHACGEKAMGLDPEPAALNHIACDIMNSAKSAKDWKTVILWADRVDPSLLSPVGMKLPDGKEGWSYLARYYNFRINGLIGTSRADEAIPLCQKALQDFPHQYKQFAYNLARAYTAVGEYDKASQTYQDLCRKVRPDFYILFEYGKVMHRLNRNDEALVLMTMAAKSEQRPDYLVGYYAEMGDLFRETGHETAARDHYMLATAVRMRNSWAVPAELQQRLESMHITSVSDSVEELLYRCSIHWSDFEGKATSAVRAPAQEEPIEHDVRGTIFLGPAERDYFFINPLGRDGYIGFKQELKHEIPDRSTVTFDVVPSFNKKKNEWTTKAVNVRPVSGQKVEAQK